MESFLQKEEMQIQEDIVVWNNKEHEKDILKNLWESGEVADIHKTFNHHPPARIYQLSRPESLLHICSYHNPHDHYPPARLYQLSRPESLPSLTVLKGHLSDMDRKSLFYQ